MRKLEILIYGICLIAILFSCQNVQDETVTLIKQGRQIEYHIKTHLIKDSFHMKLSDYASDFEFIPLETKDECLISYGMDYYFGDKYFLLEKRYGGIYQFGRDGRFIRKLVPEGKGPHDFWEGDWTVDEENQILYLSDDAKKNYFLQYDLKSGAYLGDLKKAVSCRTRTIEYLKEGLIMVNTYGRYDENGLKDYVYWQDLSGKLLSSVPARKTDAVFWSSLSNANYGDFFRLKILNNDTIYSVDNRQLTPYLTFDYGKETPTDRNAMGYVEIRIDREIEA